MYIFSLVISVLVLYLVGRTTSEKDNELWFNGEKAIIRISSLVLFSLGLFWFLQFGFVNTYDRLGAIGIPLSVIFLIWGFFLARLTYSVTLITCIVIFLTSLIFAYLSIISLDYLAAILSIGCFAYSFIIRKGVFRKFRKMN